MHESLGFSGLGFGVYSVEGLGYLPPNYDHFSGLT